ncbi:VWFA and cache domain-containing protein 1-like isoform X2 [Oratosquilla oratoria]|uniref:VWFA and cache domain-containing protein 1-like isoform X2 n=1 Tax=Oratosquilla oratoria TaxID=337810 RepID=UPI003F775BBC
MDVNKGMAFLHLLLFLACILPLTWTAPGADANRLAEEDIPWWNVNKFLLSTINNGIQHKNMKERMEMLRYVEDKEEGQLLLLSKALHLRKIFAEHIVAVRHLQDAIQDTWDEFKQVKVSEIPEEELCCSLKPSEQQSFGCTTIAPGTNASNLVQSSTTPDRVNLTVKDILKRFPAIISIYYGLEDGTFRIYPAKTASEIEKCKQYDHKIRYWYTLASSPLPKDIVVLVDMDRANSSLAEKLIHRIIKSASPNDRIAIAFSKEEVNASLGRLNNYDWTGSYEEIGVHGFQGILMSGNEKNKKKQSEFVTRNIAQGKEGNPRGFSTLREIFVCGLEMLRKKLRPSLMQNRNESERLVIVTDRQNLTEGIDPNELTRAIQENTTGRFSVVSYTLHEAAQGTVRNLLEDISSRMSGPDTMMVIGLQDEGDLYSSDTTKSFLSFHEIAENLSKPLILVPYWDNFGYGIITSICFPIVVKKTFIGATCSDIPISNELERITAIKDMGESYAFIVDTYGRVLHHPLLPSPLSLDEDPTVVDITLLETDSSVRPLLRKMVNRIEGNEEVETFFVESIGRPRGVNVPNGIRFGKKRFHYFWTPINDTDLILNIAIRIEENGKITSSKCVCKSEVECRTPHFQYHRLDTVSEDSLCRYFNATVYKGNGTVKFAPTCFHNVQAYLREENKEWEDKVTQIFRDRTPASKFKIIKEDLQKSVWLVEEAENIWSTYDATFNNNAIGSRYIGTYDGVIGTFPGVQLQPIYDPRLMTWYQQAVVNKAEHPTVTVTTPYFDSIISGMVVTVATPLQRQNMDVEAVLAADFTLQFMVNKFIEALPACRNKYTCMLVDESGYVVLHNSFYNTTSCSSEEGRAKNITAAHITKLEPDIARDLIKEGFLKRRGCVDYARDIKYYFWKLQLSYPDKSFFSHNLSGLEYAILSLPYTSLHLVLMKPQPIFQHCHCALSLEDMEHHQACVDTCRRTCECPCIADEHTQPCSTGIEDDVHRIKLPACSPTGAVDSVIRDVRNIKKPCNNYECSTRPREQCNEDIGCLWAENKCHPVHELCTSNGAPHG